MPPATQEISLTNYYTPTSKVYHKLLRRYQTHYSLATKHTRNSRLLLIFLFSISKKGIIICFISTNNLFGFSKSFASLPYLYSSSSRCLHVRTGVLALYISLNQIFGIDLVLRFIEIFRSLFNYQVCFSSSIVNRSLIELKNILSFI